MSLGCEVLEVCLGWWCSNIIGMKKVLVVGHLGVSARILMSTCLSSSVSTNKVVKEDRVYKLTCNPLPDPEILVTKEELNAHPFAKYM